MFLEKIKKHKDYVKDFTKKIYEQLDEKTSKNEFNKYKEYLKEKILIGCDTRFQVESVEVKIVGDFEIKATIKYWADFICKEHIQVVENVFTFYKNKDLYELEEDYKKFVDDRLVWINKEKCKECKGDE